jgi:hypothetical protein
MQIGFPSLAQSLQFGMATLALWATFVRGSRRELVASHADTRFGITLVVSAQSQLL